jgi:uncharacterized protein YjbI with pentapeptide repeats
MNLILSAFFSLKQDKKQKIDIVDIIFVLKIEGIILLCTSSLQLPILSANGQEEEAAINITPESMKCNAPPEPYVDLAGCDLSFANFTNVRLERANLTSANLTFADLSNVDLESANLFNATLANANLSNAFLQYADFSNSNLSNANLTGADVTGANFTRANKMGCIACP